MKVFACLTLGAVLAIGSAIAEEEELNSSSELEQDGIDRVVAAAQAELDRAAAALRAGGGRTRSVPPAGADQDIDEIDAMQPGDDGRIVNGTLTSLYPSVGAVVKLDGGKLGSWCTGTLVGCKTFVTAQHCVEDDPTPSQYRVFFQHAGTFPVESIARHSPYDFPFGDLAVLKLKEPVEGIRPTPLYLGAAVANGTEGKIIGFGRTGGTRQDYGLKRVGIIETASCQSKPGCVCWNFDAPVGLPGENSNTCNADSGGPLLVRPTSGGARLLAGVTSGGTRSSCLAGDHSYDVDVRQFGDWLTAQAGTDLNPASCGALPRVGTGKVRYQGKIIDLAGGESKDYKLNVPPGTQRLRVALNGEDRSSGGLPATDFNLYVKRGSAATPASNECAQNDSSQIGFCEFTQPASGPWYVRVAQAGPSAGSAQLVATTFAQ